LIINEILNLNNSMFRINDLYLTLSILGLISFYSCGPIATVLHEECTTALP